jgi:hypothetical protein
VYSGVTGERYRQEKVSRIEIAEYQISIVRIYPWNPVRFQASSELPDESNSGALIRTKALSSSPFLICLVASGAIQTASPSATGTDSSSTRTLAVPLTNT